MGGEWATEQQARDWPFRRTVQDQWRLARFADPEMRPQCMLNLFDCKHAVWYNTNTRNCFSISKVCSMFREGSRSCIELDRSGIGSMIRLAFVHLRRTCKFVFRELTTNRLSHRLSHRLSQFAIPADAFESSAFERAVSAPNHFLPIPRRV